MNDPTVPKCRNKAVISYIEILATSLLIMTPINCSAFKTLISSRHLKEWSIWHFDGYEQISL